MYILSPVLNAHCWVVKIAPKNILPAAGALLTLPLLSCDLWSSQPVSVLPKRTVAIKNNFASFHNFSVKLTPVIDCRVIKEWFAAQRGQMTAFLVISSLVDSTDSFSVGIWFLVKIKWSSSFERDTHVLYNLSPAWKGVCNSHSSLPFWSSGLTGKNGRRTFFVSFEGSSFLSVLLILMSTVLHQRYI